MKRRYSNFHRARKYHRRYIRALRLGHSWNVSYLADMYYKYDHVTCYRDEVNTTFTDVDTLDEKMVIGGFGTPKAEWTIGLIQTMGRKISKGALS